MDVSENSGTPKSSILMGFSIINHPFWGTPIFGNTQIEHQTGTVQSLKILAGCEGHPEESVAQALKANSCEARNMKLRDTLN